MSAFGKFIKKLDIYGHEVSMNYRGDEAYRTKFGGFFSLVTFVLIIINVTKLAINFIDKSE